MVSDHCNDPISVEFVIPVESEHLSVIPKDWQQNLMKNLYQKLLLIYFDVTYIWPVIVLKM